MKAHWRFFTLALALGLAAPSAAQDSLKPLLKKLDNKKPDARFDALMALAELGPKAAPATERLCAILNAFDEDERVLAVVALSKIGKPAIPAVEKLLAHEDELTRHDAVWTLAMMGAEAKAFVQPLLKIMQTDPDEDVRCKAAYALAQIAPRDGEVLQLFVKTMREEKLLVQLQTTIVDNLRHFGEPAIPPLAEALRDSFLNLSAQTSLAFVLERHQTKSAAKAMLPFVMDAYLQASVMPSARTGGIFLQPSPDVSLLCDSTGMAFVLKSASGELLALLDRQLASKKTEDRHDAALVLGLMAHTLVLQGDAPELVDRFTQKLLPLFESPDRPLRAAAIGTMPATKRSEPALTKALLDDDPEIRRFAFMALNGVGIAGGPEPNPISELHNRLAKSKGLERLRIAVLLGTNLYDQAAQKVLFDFLTGKDQNLRHRAAYALGSSQPITAIHADKIKNLVVPVLTDSLRSKDPALRRQAAEGLAMCGQYLADVHVPLLLGALKDKDAMTRQHAVCALRSLCGPERKDLKTILAAVKPFLTDADWQTRVYAVHGFSHSGKAGLSDLLQAFAAEKERVVRHYMMDALQQEKDPRALDALCKTADDPEDWKEAIQRLMRMGEKKTFPRIWAILCKNDDAIRPVAGDVKQPATAVDAAKALAPLLVSDDQAASRRAARALEKLTDILWADLALWTPPIQAAMAKRVPMLKGPLQTKDVQIRRAAVETLLRFHALQRAMDLHVNNRPAADVKIRRQIGERHAENNQRIDDLIVAARRDPDLAIRRLVRKAPGANAAGVVWP